MRSCSCNVCGCERNDEDEVTVGAVEKLEGEVGVELSSCAVQQIDELLSACANLDNATTQGAAVFWSKALSRFAQVGRQTDGEFLPWTADRVLAMIEDDGHSEHLLTTPEILRFFKSIKAVGFSDDDILSMWETIIYPETPISRAWDAPHAFAFMDMESSIVNGNTLVTSKSDAVFITDVE